MTECLLLGYESGAGRMVGLELGGDGGFDVGGGHGRGCFDFWGGDVCCLVRRPQSSIYRFKKYYGSRTSYVQITLGRYALPYPRYFTYMPSQ